jgi:TrmH family RNA methyltransferase
MLTREIKSLQHPIVKHLFKLRTDRSYRKECGSVLVLGHKMVAELPEAIPIKTLLIEEGTSPPKNGQEIFFVTPEILRKISGVHNPEPIAAEVFLPKQGDLSCKQYLIALDGISDPGNLGTILRSALALGWEGAFITERSTDPFNDKALRAAKGATFRLPLQVGTSEELQELIRARHLNVYSADAKGSPLKKASASPPFLLIFGNESNGVSPDLQKQAQPLSIPMQAGSDSLNVSAAAAIFLYTLKDL